MTDAKNDDACGASASNAGLGAEPKRVAQYCTFCGARDDEVQLLIACYAAMICDHCVQICNEILTEKEIPLMAQAEAVPNLNYATRPTENRMNSINALCKKALKVTDDELDEFTEIARNQLEYSSPLKMATAKRQHDLGHHNMLVLMKVRELRDTIKGGESLAGHNA